MALGGLGVRRVPTVSGDRRTVAERVAAEVACAEVVAECLPQDKVTFVRQLRGAGYRVAVVGDGVNDAPALAAGAIGRAMGAAGSDVAIHSATIALMNNDLRRLPVLVRLSRAAPDPSYQQGFLPHKRTCAACLVEHPRPGIARGAGPKLAPAA